jgi:hypothetical protein
MEELTLQRWAPQGSPREFHVDDIVTAQQLCGSIPLLQDYMLFSNFKDSWMKQIDFWSSCMQDCYWYARSFPAAALDAEASPPHPSAAFTQTSVFVFLGISRHLLRLAGLSDQQAVWHVLLAATNRRPAVKCARPALKEHFRLLSGRVGHRFAGGLAIEMFAMNSVDNMLPISTLNVIHIYEGGRHRKL